MSKESKPQKKKNQQIISIQFIVTLLHLKNQKENLK